MRLPGQSGSMIASTTPDLEVDQRGYRKVEGETMATPKKGVFAGGDIAGGAASVIRAMEDGRIAARAIHRYVMAEEASGTEILP